MRYAAILAIGFFFFGADIVDAATASASESHIDQARWFFATPAAEREARAVLENALSTLEQHKGSVVADADTLLATLRALDAVRAQGARHTLYLRLRCALDRDDATSCADEGRIDADIASRTSFVAGEILRAAPPSIAAFLARNPALAPYRYEIEDIERGREHRPGAAEESLLQSLAPEIADWQDALYRQTVDGIAFGTVKTAAGELDVIRQRSLLTVDPDRSAREQRFRKLWAGYRSARDPLAFALLHTAQAGNALAKIHRFANAPDARYFDLQLDPAATRRLIEAIAARGDLLQRFERLRASDAQRLYRIDAPEVWDADLPPPNVPRYTLDEARAALQRAFAALGSDYRSTFGALLDPHNGRLDAMPGAAVARTRHRGGFSLGFPGTTAVLFVGEFNGTYKDLSVIAHEGGHAAHRELMNRHGVLPAYASGPSYLFESFAEFNELVLADHLASEARDPELKRYFREQFLAIKGLDFLYGAEDAALEQAIYDGTLDGTLHGPDDLDALTLRSDSRFSGWTTKYPELKSRWASLSLATEDPLYYVNYLYASLLALNYYERWKESPHTFARKYVALLEHGFDAPPEALLQRFLAIDLRDDDALADVAVASVERKLADLESH